MIEGSLHIRYKKNYRLSVFGAYHRAIADAAHREKKSVADFRILDLGCGMGEFLEYAIEKDIRFIEGFDFDPVCVETSRKHAKCYLGDINELPSILADVSYDLILLSHVIEHMQNPKAVIERIRLMTNYFLIAVPNPLRPNVLYFAVRRHDYANTGHYYSWDRSHFSRFIGKCGLEIISYYVDDVLLPKNLLCNVLRRTWLGRVLEKNLLPRWLPYFSTSLIVLCRKETNSTGGEG